MKNCFPFTFTSVLLLLCISAILPVTARPQVRPVYDQGANGLIHLLKRMNTSASVMMIGAHPDDEDTGLLAYLARHENARTAYLSLTRGDGGQNIIGTELGESLGVLRTEELLQARRLDGAEQYFTRAYDFGFTKTLAEARKTWDEETVLCDVVYAIREFRPLVVISRFTGTAADGHGHHQFAGYITPLAVKEAGEWGKCPGTPWKVKKLYVSHGFRAPGEPGLRINTGQYDPILGRSYFEVAMEARSQHKSQEQGVLELKGPQYSGLNGGPAGEKSVFDGLDVSVKGIAANTNNSESGFVGGVALLQEVLREAFDNYDPRSPSAIVPQLAEAYELAVKNEWSTRRPDSKAYMRAKQIELAEAIKLAAGIQIDALAERETVTPGEVLPVSLRLYAARPDLLKVKTAVLHTEWGEEVAAAGRAAEPSGAAPLRRETATFTAQFNVKMKGPMTAPYWIESHSGDMFSWPQNAERGLPFGSPVVVAFVNAEVAGHEVAFTVPLEYRFADDVRGEVRREVNIVPALDVRIDKPALIFPVTERSRKTRIVVTVSNNSPSDQNGTLLLSLTGKEPGTFTTFQRDISVPGQNGRASVPFDVEAGPDRPAGLYKLEAEVRVGGAGAPSIYRSEMITIEYPHIQTHRFYRPASADVRVLDLKIAPVKVGYVMGSGDRVAAAIEAMGIPLEMITDADLAAGDLSRFDTIVVGIRGYQVRAALVANNRRVLDFVRRGGTLIVQYQIPATVRDVLPYPAELGPRVTDQNAAVKMIDPAEPMFATPNRITDADFAGWVQERNLYNFGKMDAAYRGLLESHDEGEPENAGGLVVAKLDKGHYIYCSYSLFRQLPAGVPGAYRLLANMLAYGRSNR